MSARRRRSTPARSSSASIASAPIDHMGERLAAFGRLDLPGDQGGNRVGRGDCRIVWADIDRRCAQRRASFGGGSGSNTSSEAPRSAPESSAARMSASTCRPPRPALMRIGPPSGPSCFSCERSDAATIPRVASVSGSSTTSMSLCARTADDTGQRLWACAPAGDLKA
jgi:hypothetical protein